MEQLRGSFEPANHPTKSHVGIRACTDDIPINLYPQAPGVHCPEKCDQSYYNPVSRGQRTVESRVGFSILVATPVGGQSRARFTIRGVVAGGHIGVDSKACPKLFISDVYKRKSRERPRLKPSPYVA